MSATDFISKTEAAKVAGVSRQTIFHWIDRGKIQVDAKGRILRQPFEAARAPHTIIGRLQAAIAELPAHQVPFILIEVLGADFVRALGNIAGQSNKTGEGKMPGNVL
jgi:hypothetical protein